LQGLVSKDSVDFGAAFSRDGKSFYFSRSENKRSNIFVSRYEGAAWTNPVMLPFNAENYSTADPAFSQDGMLYFISNRPKDLSDTLKDYDIWQVRPLSNGQWAAPENVTQINSDSNEYYISFSRNGNLYFSSSRKGGYGEEDIYVSRFVKRQYTTPENLGKMINTEHSEYDPGISAKEDMIVFASSGRQDALGKADLYYSKKENGDSWGTVQTMGVKINTATREYCPYFSPDGSWFFFSSEGDVKWIDTKLLFMHLK
jgi:Tol biopolymer transport system component